MVSRDGWQVILCLIFCIGDISSVVDRATFLQLEKQLQQEALVSSGTEIERLASRIGL